MLKMSLLSVAYVERAARLSRDLTRMKARGPGDTENAMRAIEREYGIDYGIIWRLRYRLAQCKDIGAAVYARLEAAYIAECERQARKLAHEIAVAKKLSGTDQREAALVVDVPQAAPRLPPDVGCNGEEE